MAILHFLNDTGKDGLPTALVLCGRMGTANMERARKKMDNSRACPLCRGVDLEVIRRREYESRSGRKESVTYMCRKCKAIFAAYDPENPPVDASKYTKQANICFDCENAMGGCSWSALDPVTGKPQFKPVPGWTATPAVLQAKNGSYQYKWDTYSITACPQFVPTPERKVPPDYISEPEKKPEPPKNQKVCPICGKKFIAKNKGTVYCCWDCRYQADLARKARYRAEMRGKPRRIRKPGAGVPVVCKDILTGSEMRWPSMVEAAEAIKGSQGRISAACNTGKPYRGALWRKEPKPKKGSVKNGK